VEKEFDVVIVGGGPGGLAVGCLLAREGLSTAIIEKDPAPGGRFRSVDFHGCRIDSSTKYMVSLAGAMEKTATYEYFSYLGMPVEPKMVPWTLGMVGGEKPGKIEFFEMDPALGAANFFGFFAFATGVEMGEESKQELMRIAQITADMTQEECRKWVNVSFADWIERNVEEPITKAILNGMAPITGAPPTQQNFGMVANAFRTFIDTGAPICWYPKDKTLEDAFIVPLVNYFQDHGGQLITNRTVRRINIDEGRATGAVAHDHQNRFMLEEYGARAVVCAMPIFEAVGRNVLERKHLTDDWAESVRRCAEMAGPDLSGFVLLREEVIPTDGYGWIHVFDSDYGIPTYVGDLTLGSHVNAVVPPGKQLVASMVTGVSELNPFGLTGDLDNVRKAHERWKESVEKGYPGFNDAIEFEGMNLQLNFTRYAYAVVPVELDVQSPNIAGLYFGGDSIRSIGAQMSAKCFDLAFPIRDRVLEQLRG
jgi:hypothetical protein